VRGEVADAQRQHLAAAGGKAGGEAGGKAEGKKRR
jgi:hypothetical protein